MCLLDEVLEFDDVSITCRSNSHRLADNPLRSESGSLSALHLIEYAAQTAAVHGGLQESDDNDALTGGVLVNVRKVQLQRRSLDDLHSPLIVSARELLRDAGSLVYQFSVDCAQQRLADGRLSVVRRRLNEPQESGGEHA